jgi:hypothetical protein
VFDLQNVFRSALNVFGDAVPVRRAEPKRAQHKHVEGAL